MAERVNFSLMDFKSSISLKQRWHRSRCCSQVKESAAPNSPSKKAWSTSSHSEQGPSVLMLDVGLGGIMAIPNVAERKRQLASLTMTLPFMFGWIEHK
jgi:hypothetical protein